MISAPKLVLTAMFVASLLGCNGSDESAAGTKAPAADPVTEISKLPADMPPQARKSAEAAILQQNAMNAQMDAQAAAMKKAQAGGN